MIHQAISTRVSETKPKAPGLTWLVVPQAVNGNRNKTNAGVAITGSQLLSFPEARCTESKRRGGEDTFRDTAIAKCPSWVQCEVTETPKCCIEHISSPVLSQQEQGVGFIA